MNHDGVLLDAEAINVAPLNNAPGAVVMLSERRNEDTVIVAGAVRIEANRETVA